MVQVRLNVGAAQNGSMNAVDGSGIASMSDASMLFQPRMLEPSKPRPSLKISSVKLAGGHREVLPGAEGVHKFCVHHLGPLLFGHFYYAL